jgi:hypothetical protein
MTCKDTTINSINMFPERKSKTRKLIAILPNTTTKQKRLRSRHLHCTAAQEFIHSLRDWRGTEVSSFRNLSMKGDSVAAKAATDLQRSGCLDAAGGSCGSKVLRWHHALFRVLAASTERGDWTTISTEATSLRRAAPIVFTCFLTDAASSSWSMAQDLDRARSLLSCTTYSEL